MEANIKYSSQNSFVHKKTQDNKWGPVSIQRLVNICTIQKDYNNQSCSKMWDGTIPPEGSHFPVRNEACRVSDDRKCEPEGGIVQSHIFDHDWLFLSHFSAEDKK